jgi:hypothetical protein
MANEEPRGNPNHEAAKHHREAAELYEQAASNHRLAAEAYEIGDQGDAERLAAEASKLHREGMKHEEEADRHRG